MLNGFKPRLYQETILSNCVDKNTLVVLPTGMGKTAVAMMLAVQRLKQFPKSKIIFLAPTKPLAQQHLRYFNQHVDTPSVLFTGSVAPKKRELLWKDAQLVFSTPQGLVNDVVSNRIDLKDVSLLVVDEAHRAVGDYDYVFLAKQFNKKARFPKILALTASPGSDLEKIEEVCKNLFIESVEIRTDSDPDVKPYIKDIDVCFVKVDLPKDFLQIKNFLENCIKSKLSEMEKFGFARKGMMINKREFLALQSRLHGMMASGSRDFPVLKSVSLMAEVMKTQHALELLETQGITPLYKYLRKLVTESRSAKTKAIKNLVADLHFKSAYIKTERLFNDKVEHPKLGKLKELIKKEADENLNVKIILFTQFRDSAVKIKSELEDIPGVFPAVFVGQAKKNGTGLTQKEQIETIELFKDGVFNTLIATSLHPDELIVLKDPENQICIREIGEFVDSINKNKRKLNGWNALSIDKKQPKFFPITQVHKHKRRSKVVEIKLSSGFNAKITEDHSIFSFDKEGKLIETFPKKNLFINIGFSAPNNTIIDQVDIVKELLTNSIKDIKNIFCHILGLSQAKIRMLTSELKFLQVIKNKKLYMEEISHFSKLDLSTVCDVYARLKDKNCVKRHTKGREKMCEITERGGKYLNCLLWFFNTYKYHKKKYRLSLKQVAKAPKEIDAFFDIHVGVWYGKKTVSRFLKITPDLAEFLGIYVAEGNARKTTKTSNVYLAGRKKDMQERMIRTIKNIGFVPSVSWRGVTIHNQIAYHLIKNVFKCGIGSWNKKIPSIIFNAKNNIKWKFLEGYFAGDGHKRTDRLVLTTVSRKLAAGLVLLLRQLGIKKITVNKDHCFRINIYESLPFVKIKENKGRKTYYNTVPRALTRKDHFKKYKNIYFNKKIGRTCRSAKIPKEQTCFDYIKDIKILKKQPKYVYDISVDHTEKFFGGVGLINFHNSVAEEGLDIPKVDLVVFYEPIPSAIRHIQRRGRTGRQEKGRVVVLMAKNTRDEGYRWSAHYKEKRMYKILEDLRNNLNKKLEKQPNNLNKYIDCKQELKVFADFREKGNHIVKELCDNNIVVKLEALDCADYILSSRVGVEVKTVPDFVNSIVDGRLLSQLKSLKQKFERPIIIIEGEENLFTIRNVHPNAIRGMIATIAVSYGIPIVQTKDFKETTAFLVAIAKREQEKIGDKDFSPHFDKKVLCLKEQQEYIISALPSIGPTAAKELLKHFKSVKNIVNASEEDFKKVNKIGDKIAKALKDVFEGEYE